MLIDLNLPPPPPQVALPVGVGLGKTTAMQRAVAQFIDDGHLGRRKIVVGVPRLDLAAEQRRAFEALGVRAAVWQGRSAPDPTPTNPDQLMCLDPSAPADAIEVERVVEQTSCRVVRNGVEHICPFYRRCGYQAQKEPARQASVIITAHETLFHQAPRDLGAFALLVLDEGFWTAGLRGFDGKQVVTIDGLEPTLGTVQCYTATGKEHVDNTADLADYRGRLFRYLRTAPNGPIPVAALHAVGLTKDMCDKAVGLEHRRMRNAGILPGMDPSERAKRMALVLPEPGEPWAPPRRAAAMWRLLGEALDNDHDAAGVVVFNDVTENGTVRSLKLRWKAPLRTTWGGKGPILHLDATLRPELVTQFIPDITVEEPVTATEPHVHVRQILGAPTSAKALIPGDDAAPRYRTAAETHLRELKTLIALRAGGLQGRSPSPPDVLVIAQKGAIEALRGQGLPANVGTAHFNALSGMDGWRNVAGLVIIGRTLPAPATVETIATALTNQAPEAATKEETWWYGNADHEINLADGGVHALSGEVHADPMAEAVRWSICEGELVQALGRGRGVNRTVETPLEIDLLTDVVLPITVNEVLSWEDVQPTRHDMMAVTGVVLENAADMAKTFPDLWSSHDAARQEKARSVTNCYYRDSYNSKMSHSSSVVTYRPAGAGQKDRQARFDLDLIADPRAWLQRRLGDLAHFEMVGGDIAMATAPAAATADTIEPSITASPTVSDAMSATFDIADARARLTDLSARLDAAIHQRIANDRARLVALSARLEAARPRVEAA